MVLGQGRQPDAGIRKSGVCDRLPSHGSRLHEIRGITLADYPKAVVEFIERRGLRDVVLVGNSTARLISQLTAQQIPERIAHIIW